MREPKKCLVCELEFIPSKRHRTLCSHKCAKQRAIIHRRHSKICPTMRNCMMCGVEFLTLHSTKKNCSTECGLKYRAQYYHMPGVKTKAHIYGQKLEVKFRVKKYHEGYILRHGVKSKLDKYQKEYHHRLDVKERRKQLAQKSKNITHGDFSVMNMLENTS